MQNENLVSPHAFDPLTWSDKFGSSGRCKACYFPRWVHPMLGWSSARPLNDRSRLTFETAFALGAESEAVASEAAPHRIPFLCRMRGHKWQRLGLLNANYSVVRCAVCRQDGVTATGEPINVLARLPQDQYVADGETRVTFNRGEDRVTIVLHRKKDSLHEIREMFDLEP